MRLWSLHPSALDRQGLIACWREALLAQAVLLGRTRGYIRHPQLERFRAHEEPPAAIGAYLSGLHAEALARGYRFDAGRIAHPAETASAGAAPGEVPRIDVTLGQLEFEQAHLRAKLARRSPEMLQQQADAPEGAESHSPVHPLFRAVAGDIESWERA